MDNLKLLEALHSRMRGHYEIDRRLAEGNEELKLQIESTRFILDYIDTHLLPNGKSCADLTSEEADILTLLCGTVEPCVFLNDVVPPLTCLELYICCHEASKPQLPFVSNWIHKGFFEYYLSHNNMTPINLENCLSLKCDKRSTPFSLRYTNDLHYRLSFLIHAYRVIGRLTIPKATKKALEEGNVIKQRAMCGEDYFKGVYNEYRRVFAKLWERDFVASGYTKADLPGIAEHVFLQFVRIPKPSE